MLKINLLILDNYDSFVYNLARYFEELGCIVRVVRNDEITLEEVRALKPDGLVISPGPKSPVEAGLSVELVRSLKEEMPILGVCLGHQCIAHAFDGIVEKSKRPMHGKLSLIKHDGKGLFKGLKNNFLVTRYHSLVVDRESLPDCLQITCETDDGIIMGLRHKEFKIEGVQFHPEAELTEYGHEILKNFLNMIKLS